MISVIIPSYNSENTIVKCLDSLGRQTHESPYEIILVDSSIDSTSELVRTNYPDISFVHLEEKTDPGTARNIGITMAKGDLIAFIDSDCVAAPDWLDRIVKAHESEYKVVGGAVQNGNHKNDLVGWAGYMSEFRDFLPGKQKEEVNHIPTCNISYKKVIFDKYGLFEGRYYPQEDLVFNHHLIEKGERILFDPSIQVHHHHRSKLKDYFLHQNRIGHVTSVVLKHIELEGSFIARNRFLSMICIPLLPVVKFTRTVLKIYKESPHLITKRPMVLLIFLMGLIFWVIGFTKGTYEKSLS